METHSKLDTPSKLGKAKHDLLSVFFKGHSRRGGLAGGHGAKTKAAVRNGAARRNAKDHLIGDDGFPGSGFVDHLLCNHINIMEDLIDSKDLVAANSDYIKQDQLHGDSDFVCIDTEWSQASWGYGPDGYITEFGAADAEERSLVRAVQRVPGLSVISRSEHDPAFTGDKQRTAIHSPNGVEMVTIEVIDV